jgi:hypothetical protein
MSIIRVGLAETKNFSDGYDLIFGKKEDKEQKAQAPPQEPEAKAAEQAQEKK